MWYIHTMEFYLIIEKKEMLPFVTTWMDLEGFMLSEVSQTEKDKYCIISLICGSKKRICLPMQGNGFEPWSRKIPHAAEQLSPCATTTEPVL